MYCRASATLAMRSSSRTRDMAAFCIPKTNWAANLPSRGRPWIASRYTTAMRRLAWTAFLLCAFYSMRPAAAVNGTLSLHDCRLEHPLQVASVAARCGVLQVAENPAEPSGRTIGLHVAVVPALNRRSRAAPLFLLAGGPGQAASDLYVSYAGAFV